MKTLQELVSFIKQEEVARLHQLDELRKQRQSLEAALTEQKGAKQIALEAGDQAAYHDADSKIAFLTAALGEKLDETAVWWTTEEAAKLQADLQQACNEACKPLYKEAYNHLLQAEKLYQQIHALQLKGSTADRIITAHVKDARWCMYDLSDKRLPYPLMRKLGQWAGESYVPPKTF